MTRLGKTRITLTLAGAWLLLMVLGCGGSGPGSHEGTYCNPDDGSQCITLTAQQGGSEGTDNQGAMDTIQLSVDGRTSTTSECSWGWDPPSCDFAFGPSVISRPPRSPLTTIQFWGDYATMTGADLPAGTHGTTHWTKQ